MKPPAHDVLDLIGNTPLVELKNLDTGDVRVFGKAEFLQPGGSVKDRAARAIVAGARREGSLEPGQVVVEMTSGNMGAGLALVCAVLHHPFVAVMSEGNSPERARMMKGLGAEVILVPQVDGRPGQVTGADIKAAAETARGVAEERGGYYVDQFRNPHCVRAHEEETGPEIWGDLAEQLSAFVASVGTGGTFIGVSRFLKSRKPEVLCYPVEPKGAEVLAGQPVHKATHLLQGTGYGSIPPQWQPELADDFLSVTDSETEEMRKELGRREGLYVGYSAAANVVAAVGLARSGRLPAGTVIATILCDTGLKYG